ncbi:MAG: NAD(+) diphosphatase, partial [Deltaproteobacteria bacterium]|nr:NAD(+) diphosphatase [Deltaproteobacteria bacterium]
MNNLAMIDRRAEKRRDEKWLAARLEAADTLFLPLWRGKNLFAAGRPGRPVLLPRTALAPWLAAAVPVFLGCRAATAIFALELPAADDAVPAALAPQGEFRTVRRLLAAVPAPELYLLFYARALLYWHRRQRFCGDCGQPTASRWGGHLRQCVNPDCGSQHFPRTDPAIIVRVADGERCLLARQPAWPPGMFSVLAGFVEPGETLEEAVAREVREEAGIEVEAVTYVASQPWPFPGSLMLGFTARAAGGRLVCADDELEEVRW